mmetsp:Transcript_47916/g.93623  ORF Transcript_47916/g.93623 Transcript_47916/m.93623 type:complete len:242 (-) Transcript_47916:547-1272(-)
MYGWWRRGAPPEQSLHPRDGKEVLVAPPEHLLELPAHLPRTGPRVCLRSPHAGQQRRQFDGPAPVQEGAHLSGGDGLHVLTGRDGPGEGSSQREDLVREDGEGIDVGARAVGLGEAHLGGHVPPAARLDGEVVEAAVVRTLRIRRGPIPGQQPFGEAKVEELRGPVAIEAHVLRLEVPVENVAAVQEPDRPRHLHQHHQPLRPQVAPRHLPRPQRLPQTAPLRLPPRRPDAPLQRVRQHVQ